MRRRLDKNVNSVHSVWCAGTFRQWFGPGLPRTDWKRTPMKQHIPGGDAEIDAEFNAEAFTQRHLPRKQTRLKIGLAAAAAVLFLFPPLHWITGTGSPGLAIGYFIVTNLLGVGILIAIYAIDHAEGAQ